MSDWTFLNQNRIKASTTRVDPRYISEDSDGFMGLFRFMVRSKFIRVIASDGGGWQHVSVSVEYDNKPPSWAIMCAVKDLFWEDEDWVVQFHPAKSCYVNHHQNCLHLWRYIGGGPFEMPTPHALMVGPKA